MYESLIEVAKINERAYFLHARGSLPVSNGSNFCQIYFDTLSANNEA